jgi:hypothetical protein
LHYVHSHCWAAITTVCLQSFLHLSEWKFGLTKDFCSPIVTGRVGVKKSGTYGLDAKIHHFQDSLKIFGIRTVVPGRMSPQTD